MRVHTACFIAFFLTYKFIQLYKYDKDLYYVLQVDMYKRRREDALLTADAYRMAFEEQLASNRRLLLKITELSYIPMQKTDRVKTALRWVISQLNDGMD